MVHPYPKSTSLSCSGKRSHHLINVTLSVDFLQVSGVIASTIYHYVRVTTRPNGIYARSSWYHWLIYEPPLPIFSGVPFGLLIQRYEDLLDFPARSLTFALHLRAYCTVTDSPVKLVLTLNGVANLVPTTRSVSSSLRPARLSRLSKLCAMVPCRG